MLVCLADGIFSGVVKLAPAAAETPSLLHYLLFALVMSYNVSGARHFFSTPPADISNELLEVKDFINVTLQN
jgi:hypothetical protein